MERLTIENAAVPGKSLPPPTDVSWGRLPFGVAATSIYNGTISSTIPHIPLPAGIEPGNLLIVFLRTAVGSLNTTWPAGWTEMFDESPDSTTDQSSAAYRVADGTEGATVTPIISSSRAAAVAWRIQGAIDPAVQPPEFSAGTFAISATPDPGAIIPTGGSKGYLFLWVGGWAGNLVSPPVGSPLNYSNPIGASTYGGVGIDSTHCGVGGAERLLTAVSEDPPSWTISGIRDWTAYTFAVHPAP